MKKNGLSSSWYFKTNSVKIKPHNFIFHEFDYNWFIGHIVN